MNYFYAPPALLREARRRDALRPCSFLVCYRPLASVLAFISERLFAGFRPHRVVSVLVLITLGVSCALQAPPGRKTLRTTSGLSTLATRRSDQPPPLAAAAVRKAAARLAFTGLVATAASFAPVAAAKGGGRGGGGGSSSYSSSYRSSSYRRSYWRDEYYDDDQVAVPPLVVCGFLGLSIGIDILVDPDSKPGKRRRRDRRSPQ